MWSDTQITKRLGVAYPIIQAPFGTACSRSRSPQPCQTRAALVLTALTC